MVLVNMTMIVMVHTLSWLDVSFLAPVYPGEALTLKAVVAKVDAGIATCELAANKADGTPTAKGEAGFKL